MERREETKKILEKKERKQRNNTQKQYKQAKTTLLEFNEYFPFISLADNRWRGANGNAYYE